jgi:TolB-like protein
MRTRDTKRRLAPAGMRLRLLRALPAVLFLATLCPVPSLAGQVITKEVREWAAEAVKEEKAVQPAAGRNTLAVLPFENNTGLPQMDPLRKGMALMLTTDLASVSGLQVVERVRLQALLDEMELGVSGLVEAGTEPRAGRVLGAQWIVGGDLSGGQAAPLNAESRVLDVPKSDIIGRPETSGTVEDLFRIEKDLLFGIISLLEIEISPEEEQRLRKPCSTKTGALFALFRAVDESDRGNYENSAEYYEQALKEDPGICLAADALTELRALNLIAPPRKRTSETLRTLKGETSLTDQLAPKDQTRRAISPGGLPIPEDLRVPVNVDVSFP